MNSHLYSILPIYLSFDSILLFVIEDAFSLWRKEESFKCKCKLQRNEKNESEETYNDKVFSQKKKKVEHIHGDTHKNDHGRMQQNNALFVYTICKF